MKYSFKIRRNYFARIPKGTRIFAVILCVVMVLLFINLFFPKVNMLKEAHKTEVSINSTYQMPSFPSQGLVRRTFVVNANERAYYFDIPIYSEENDRFLAEIERDLLNRQIESATVVVTTKQSIYDQIHNRYRILSLCVDGVEYLSIETTKILLIWDYIGAWFVFLLASTFSALYILLTVISYGALKIEKRKT